MTDQFGGYKVHPVAARFPLLAEKELEKLIDDIKQNGLLHPIVLNYDDSTIIDGRNRWIACDRAGVDPVFRRLGKHYSELEIIRFIAGTNLQRRHLTVGQLAMIAVEIAKDLAEEAARRERRGTVAPIEARGKSSEHAASIVGIGHTSVERAQTVVDRSPRLAEQVAAGDLTLDAAYKQVKDSISENKPKPAKAPEFIELTTHEGNPIKYRLPQGKPTFNKTNQQVSWSAWTWNPVTGCLHGCKYCYARELALRQSYKDSYPVGFTPLFHHERLDAPANTEVPKEAVRDPRLKRVFVCSMADLYGKWVPDEWIEQVHASCISNPQWEYLMLTKFPRRYVGMKLPETAWLGTSVDEQKRVRLAEEAFRQIDGVRVKWLSLEPLLAPLQFSDLSMFDWIVIGSQSATEQPDGHVKEFAPPFEWVARIVAQAREAGCRVYLKPNLLGIVNPQSAGMNLPQEEPSECRNNLVLLSARG